jgi:anti-sigma factor RsiW
MEPRSGVRLGPSAMRCLHRHAMPTGLRRSLLEAIAGDRHRPAVTAAAPRPALYPIGAGFAAGVLACALILDLQSGSRPDEVVVHDVVSSHVRSLMAGHLSDVASTDAEAVSVWFRDKLDFSPRFGDMAAQGYALAGGRLDYVGGRRVAAAVYLHARHVVNVFTCPLDGRVPDSRNVARRGFNAVAWSDAAMQYWAVGDLDMDELRRFASELRGRRASD